MKNVMFKLSVCLYLIPMILVGTLLAVILFPVIIGVIGAKDILNWYENRLQR